MEIFCRNYDAESERQKSVEEFYRLNHINQTYDFVSTRKFSLLCFGLLKRVQTFSPISTFFNSFQMRRIWYEIMVYLGKTGEENERGIWEIGEGRNEHMGVL